MCISKKTNAFLNITHEWETAEYDVEKLAVYWYVPIEKRKNRGIRKMKITFNFKKGEDLKMFLYDSVFTEWFGYYVNSQGREVKLYTQQKSEFTKK